MMSDTSHRWERLNAYVDGELGVQERAEVAADIAARPDLAQGVAALTKMKAALATEDIAAQSWSEVAPQRPAVSRSRIAARVAAALIIAVALGATFAAWRGGERTAGWLDAPLAAHDAWVATGAPELPEGGAGAMLVGLGTLGPDALIPDLSAAKLTNTGARFIPALDGRPPAMQLAYSGTRGCRVTLWITPLRDGVSAALRLDWRDPYRVYSWRAGDLAYALLSAMDPARFEVVAEAARKTTIDHARPDVETETALRQSRAESPPCAA
jgi:anti-sigma factor RsiW